MPTGWKMRVSKYSSSGTPLTVSTMCPSVTKPSLQYDQAVLGGVCIWMSASWDTRSARSLYGETFSLHMGGWCPVRPMPLLWFRRTRGVILPVVSGSQIIRSGRYVFAGSSTEILPCSTSCMMAVPVIDLVREQIGVTVSGVIGSCSLRIL